MESGRGHKAIEEHPSDVQWTPELKGAVQNLQPINGIGDHEDHRSRYKKNERRRSLAATDGKASGGGQQQHVHGGVSGQNDAQFQG
jgi:hypothetical protein